MEWVWEAKRASESPHLGERQAKLYADWLEQMTGQRPIILYTNGFEHWIWDNAGGYPPRTASPTSAHPPTADRRADRLGHRRNDITNTAPSAIDGSFDGNRRAAILVMATGSGKTRTVVARVKQLMEANRAKRVLLLADPHCINYPGHQRL